MPRTREFDPDQALEAAMLVFWEKGYSATSVDDLVRATGVNRYGLYDVFASKRGLFLKAIAHYHRTVIVGSIEELERPDAGLTSIRTVFDRLVYRVRAGEASYGCLLCNTAEEVAPFDSEVAREVADFQDRLVRVFQRAVTNARRDGSLRTNRPAPQLARYLAGLIQGASFLARSPAPPRAVADFVAVGLQILD